MLDQNFAMAEGYQTCDTTTPQGCLTTPFSVKDILNLNISGGSEYSGYHPSANRVYEECYQSQEMQPVWESGYEQYNYGYYGGVEVKTEPCFVSKSFGCESVYGVGTPLQQICALSAAEQEASKDMVYVKTESPSKLYAINKAVIIGLNISRLPGNLYSVSNVYVPKPFY